MAHGLLWLLRSDKLARTDGADVRLADDAHRGAAQSPVTSSAANGANVTGIAGALVDRLTLNAQGAPTLAETRIAFTSDRDGNTQIYTMNADGTGVTRLTNNGAFDSSPNWSFDNSKIAFESNRDGNYEVYAMNADGTGQTRLTNNPASIVTAVTLPMAPRSRLRAIAMATPKSTS